MEFIKVSQIVLPAFDLTFSSFTHSKTALVHSCEFVAELSKHGAEVSMILDVIPIPVNVKEDCLSCDSLWYGLPVVSKLLPIISLDINCVLLAPLKLLEINVLVGILPVFE